MYSASSSSAAGKLSEMAFKSHLNGFSDFVSVIYDGALMPTYTGNYTFYLQ